jgi:hypothetical protein
MSASWPIALVDDTGAILLGSGGLPLKVGDNYW